MPALPSAGELITTDLYENRGRSRLVAIMRNCRLSFVLGVVAPIVLGWTGCFIATEGETYDDTLGETGGSNECTPDEIGTEGCPCTSGDACNMPLKCNINLDRCISDLCPLGDEGCECTSGGECNPDLQCLSGFCVDNTCPTGQETCNCTPGGGCDPGLVCAGHDPGENAGVCVDPDDVTTGASQDDNDSADTNPPDTGDADGDTSSGGSDTTTGTPDPDTTAGGEAATTGN
jgi:hypothetical protein